MAHDRFFLGRPFVLNPKFTTETVEKITTVLRATGYDFFAKKLRLIIFLIDKFIGAHYSTYFTGN